MIQDEIGRLADTYAERDAVHIAVAPVTAMHQLRPGMPVRFAKPGNTNLVIECPFEKMIGIVDPFLAAHVQANERFFMYLKPNTITALRHHWTHPAFAAETTNIPKEAARIWLDEFAREQGCDFDQLLDGAAEAVETDYFLIRDGSDRSGKVPETFWIHYTAYTGKPGPRDPSEMYFSCSC